MKNHNSDEYTIISPKKIMKIKKLQIFVCEKKVKGRLWDKKCPLYIILKKFRDITCLIRLNTHKK